MRVPSTIRLASAILLGCGGAAFADPAANALLFETPYLSRLEPGAVLSYRYVHTTSDAKLGPSFEDVVEMRLSAGKDDGERTATVRMFTGERRGPGGTFADMTGNPLVVLFLERDLLDMSRRLGGSPHYIRNRVRTALEQAASVTATRVEIDGRTVDGWTIAITPFASDRNRDRFREFAGKRYEIVLADGVPGGIYALSAVTPGAEGAAALVEDRLVFSGAGR